MINLALKRNDAQPRMQYGQILDVKGERFVVRTDDFDVSAERAASCLLLPRCGDEVLLVLHDGGPGFILAVLKQQTARCGEESPRRKQRGTMPFLGPRFLGYPLP